MASQRFIAAAQDAYRQACAANDQAEAERIFRWIEAALTGASNRDCEWLSDYTPKRRTPKRSTAAMVAEMQEAA